MVELVEISGKGWDQLSVFTHSTISDRGQMKHL